LSRYRELDVKFRIADSGLRTEYPRRDPGPACRLRRGATLWAAVLVLAAPGLVLAQADGGAAAAETPVNPPAAAASVWEAVLFYIVGGTAALTALGCVLSTNIVRMATCLFGTLGAVAILYFLMAANFLGAIQLIVYAGGTLIVIIFGVMLTSKSPWVKYNPRPVELLAGGAACGILFAGLAVAMGQADWGRMTPNPDGFEVARIGWSLLTTYLVPFELASVLLLAVMIGAAYLARPERGE
jgi:NADH-quinone oxidoreductase subunit J